jgi:carboxylesterase
MIQFSERSRVWLSRSITLLAGAVSIALIFVIAIYLWPHHDFRLQFSEQTIMSYDESVKAAKDAITEEAGEGSLAPECRTKLLTHGKQTARSVVMYQGYTACTDQFSDLAKKFFDDGYNVYIPRTPHHGFKEEDSARYGNLTALDLSGYARDAVTVATGLGEEVGVIGLSGGGTLATWVSQYRPDVVERMMVISPLYQVAGVQAPRWQIPALVTLYGNKVLPDAYSEPENKGFSYYGIAQYLKLVHNFKNPPENGLKRLVLVTATADQEIDLSEARDVTLAMVDAGEDVSYEELIVPKSTGLAHTAGIEADTPDPKLLDRYLELYQDQ